MEFENYTERARGFIQSAAKSVAKLTPIVSSGAANPNERLYFNGSLRGSDVFPTTSVAPARSWATAGWSAGSWGPAGT